MDRHFFNQFDTIIDARTPKEFAESHIPNAINIPSLFDDERKEIGTLYKKDAFAARQSGAALVATNIATHLSTTLKEKPQNWQPLIYCARGGQRSAALVDILKKIGWQATQLEGGYKHYRQHILQHLQTCFNTTPFIVIGGKTGVGKTKLLNYLAAQGKNVLNLEHFANHRGSVFGENQPQPSQRHFDNLLYFKLQQLLDNRYIFIEAESSRIGKIQIPPSLTQKMRSSIFIRLNATMPDRIKMIKDDYQHFLQDEALFTTTLQKLSPFLGKKIIEQLHQLYQQKQWALLIELLLTQHYDKRYEKALQANYGKTDSSLVLTVNPTEKMSIATTAQALQQAINK